MIFYTFASQEERRKAGGSDFIELQYCRLEQGSKIKKIVSVDAVKHWENDSLYIFGDDVNEFVSRYGKYFSEGTYNNGKSGIVDICGINYYSRKQAEIIIEQVKREKPPYYEILLEWMKNIGKYIGFYVLGV